MADESRHDIRPAKKMTTKRTKRRKNPKPMDLPNPLIVDEGEFTDIVRKMVTVEPTTLEEMKSERRKNPETDPRYLPVFDFSQTIRIEKPKKK